MAQYQIGKLKHDKSDFLTLKNITHMHWLCRLYLLSNRNQTWEIHEIQGLRTLLDGFPSKIFTVYRTARHGTHNFSVPGHSSCCSRRSKCPVRTRCQHWNQPDLPWASGQDDPRFTHVYPRIQPCHQLRTYHFGLFSMLPNPSSQLQRCLKQINRSTTKE